MRASFECIQGFVNLYLLNDWSNKLYNAIIKTDSTPSRYDRNLSGRKLLWIEMRRHNGGRDF